MWDKLWGCSTSLWLVLGRNGRNPEIPKGRPKTEADRTPSWLKVTLSTEMGRGGVENEGSEWSDKPKKKWNAGPTGGGR